MAKQDALRIVQSALSNNFLITNEDEAFDALSEHFLCGWYYSRFKNHLESPKWKQKFTRQSLQNSLLLSELECVEALFPSVRLKGTSFFPWLYSDLGERHLTDADILVEPKYLDVALDSLTDRGYFLTSQVKWGPNHHRFSMTRASSHSYNYQVDIHTQLHWEQDPKFKIETQQFGNFNCLKKCHLQYHLYMNWAFQDTFVGLNKLVDIHLLDSQCTSEEKLIIENLFTSTGLSSVYTWVNKALAILRGTERSQLMTGAFLSSPKSKPFRYLMLKHLNKKNWLQALKYDRLWASAFIRNIERP